MICKSCGSNKFVEKNGKLVCEYCGSEAEIKKTHSNYVSQEDYDRYHRLLKTRLMDISDEDLLWCYYQENQHDEEDEEIWLEEIECRNIKV